MKSRTTIFLFTTVLLVGGYIWFVDRRVETTDQKKEFARRAVRVDPAQVTRLSIVSDDLQVACERRNKQWFITSPVSAPADAGAVENFLESLRDLSRAEIVTEGEQKEGNLSREQYGLAVPRVRITLEQNQQELVLLVGRDAPLGGHLYLQQEGRGDIIVTETNLLAALPKSATDLRDRRLFQGYPGDVSRLDAKRTDGFLRLAKSGAGDWLIQKPVQGRADAAAVQELLDQLFDARAQDFVADSVAAASLYGLDEPAAQVTLVLDPAGLEQTLLLGTALETRTNEIYASVQGSDTVCAISNSILAALKVPLADLRDRRLLAMSAYDISYIQIEKGEETLKLQSTNSTEWLVVEPRQYPADAAVVQLLLSAWTGIRVESFHDDYETNLDTLGLSSPSLKITFARSPPVRDVVAVPGGETSPAPVPVVEPPAGDSVTVWVSSRPPTDRGITVRLGGENTVCDIPAGPVQSLVLDPLVYRDRALVALDAAQVRSLHVQVGSVTQAVQRADTNGFQAVEAAVEMDDEAVRGVLGELGRLRAERLVEEDPKDLNPYGLVAPSATLTVGLSGDEGISKSILFGSEAEGGTVYAMVKGQDVIFTIAKAVRDKLLATLYKVPASEETPDDQGPATPAGTAP